MKIFNSFLKVQLTIVIFVFSHFTAYCQKDNDIMEMWNSEIENVGNRMVNEIDAELITYSSTKKIIISNNYKNGSLTFYQSKSSIIKIVRSYSIDSIQYVENYYYRGRWPIYVDRKRSTSNNSDKFYFDKTNLLLWISENNKRLNAKAKNYKKNWSTLLENMDKLSVIANLKGEIINEDEIKIPK